MSQSASKSFDTLRACLVFLCACAVYFPALHNQFALDDLIHIVHNSAIQNREAWGPLFWSATYPGNLFRPLTNVSYAISFEIFGLTALPYHVTNILLHAATSAGIYFLLIRLSMRPLALATALLFAVHPLHVEAVANVSGRAELLAAFFVVLTLHLFLTHIDARSSDRAALLPLFAASISFLAAVLCKESAIALLGLAILLIYARDRKIKNFIPALLCLGLICVLFAAWRSIALGMVSPATSDTELLDNPLVALNVVPRILLALALLGKYVALSVIPYPLSADYSFAAIDPGIFWGDIQNWLNLLLTVLLVGVSLYSFRKDKALAFLSMWFFICFAITANIFFPIGTIFAERLAYLPSLGIVGLLVVCAHRYLALSVGRIALCLIGAAYMLETWGQSRVWQDNTTLHSYQMTISPESAKTLVNFGMVVRNSGDADGASAYFRQALQIYPHFANAAYGLGSTYTMKGMPSGAEHWYHEALKISPTHVPSLEALGRLYLNNGKNEEARLQFEKVLSIDENSTAARLGLFALLLNEGKYEEARHMQQMLASLAHDDVEYKKLSEALEKKIAR